MESIFNQLNDSFEIVVCDNRSSDGSNAILQEYARKGKIKLFVENCSRGKGRQIAFEKSTGEYIISGLDTDDRLKPVFQKFLSLYHKDHEGYMLSAGTIHVIPRQLVEEIGGWRDLKWGEDVDFRRRATSLGLQHEFEYDIALVERGHNKRSLTARISNIYDTSVCCYRIGTSVSDQVKMTALFNKPAIFGFAVAAFIVSKCRRIQKFRYQKV
jgi:glycosyltransferase involved in cell wall biosynthesis